MKNPLSVLLLFLLVNPVFSKNPGYEYKGRFNPSVKKEKLSIVNTVNDIPQLWNKLVLPFEVQEELDHRRKIDEKGCFVFYPQGYNYSRLIEYVAVEISATSNNEVLKAQSTSDVLTPQQRAILNNADLNTNIVIEIRFKFKKLLADNRGVHNDKIMNGGVVFTVVPEIEAEFPGGFKQLTNYLTENIVSRVTEKLAAEKLQFAAVKFTVDENGLVVDAKVIRTSSVAKTDKLILDAINKMPKWKPAGNSKGEKLKQEFTIPFGDGC